MSCGIGQGELQLTTLQMANLAACIANRGYWYPPHLIKEFKDGTPIPERFYEKHQIEIDRRHFETVVEGMSECVIRGTARIAQVPGVAVCGKTGTSQNPHGDDHSVFFAFAPKDNPQIAIAVYVENAGWGASYAAPIAGLMIEKMLNDTISADRIAIEERMFTADLTSKILANRAQEKIQAKLPKPKPDSLPDPAKIPTEVPDAVKPGESKPQTNRRK
jgi:penicillin-binding protein 2